jgi:Ni,Fe-hydrogenase III large subunit
MTAAASLAMRSMTPPVVVVAYPFANCCNEFRVRREDMTVVILMSERRPRRFDAGPTTYAETLPSAHQARSGIGIAECWRGTIVHRVETDANGRVNRAKIVDPSWFNWTALRVAMADTIGPGFPLADNSFNQSYAGNDL